MHNQQPSEAVHGKDYTVPAKSPRETVSSNASEQHHDASCVTEAVREAVPEWQRRRYVEGDFVRLEKLLEDEDEDCRPTPQQLESLKAFCLNKPVGTIKRYIDSGREPPADWVELGLYHAAIEWMNRDL